MPPFSFNCYNTLLVLVFASLSLFIIWLAVLLVAFGDHVDVHRAPLGESSATQQHDKTSWSRRKRLSAWGIFGCCRCFFYSLARLWQCLQNTLVTVGKNSRHTIGRNRQWNALVSLSFFFSLLDFNEEKEVVEEEWWRRKSLNRAHECITCLALHKTTTSSTPSTASSSPTSRSIIIPTLAATQKQNTLPDPFISLLAIRKAISLSSRILFFYW